MSLCTPMPVGPGSVVPAGPEIDLTIPLARAGFTRVGFHDRQEGDHVALGRNHTILLGLDAATMGLHSDGKTSYAVSPHAHAWTVGPSAVPESAAGQQCPPARYCYNVELKQHGLQSREQDDGGQNAAHTADPIEDGDAT
jgi:hypothetical protein